MKFGAIFDWDGVIVDSSKYHKQSWEVLAEEENQIVPAGFFKLAFGMKNENIIPEILKWQVKPGDINRLSLRKEELYRTLMAEQGLQPLRGVTRFLTMLKRNGIPCAIGTSTHRSNVTGALEEFNMANNFEGMIGSEDVTEGKPDPQVFLKAAELLNIDPRNCIAFEDVPVGIEAARNAGMKAIAVTTTHVPSKLTEADLVVDQLDQLSLQRLQELFGA
ncbi:MAG: HAD-IA family hydrolase [Chitinivibrionales bacterium]|nr:HAD-IA family hydrolase [Chitinivibrionales bacterium]